MNRKIVLVLSGAYLPAHKYGGPVKSVSNIVEQVHDHYDFKIITRDRDLGEKEPLKNIKVDCWQGYGRAQVYYASQKGLNIFSLSRIINNTEYDLLYLNSFFHPIFTIQVLIMWKLGLISNKPVLLAPRGEFSKGAINIKYKKKSLYILLAKLFGLYRNVIWHATNELEKTNIERYFKGIIRIAPNLTSSNHYGFVEKEKNSGSVKFVFLSRISKEKNLHQALEMMKSLNGEIVFDIFGPKEDLGYYEYCMNIKRSMPSNIKCDHRGSVLSDAVLKTLSKYHFFFFPTLGENYGHVIVEALTSSCPVIISDRTPWLNIEEKSAGWVIPIENTHRFNEVLNKCVAMNNDEYKKLSVNAYRISEEVNNNKETIAENIRLFDLEAN